jgi:hypothetical protein
VWYRALTQYFTRVSDFSEARTATVRAAADLYGPSSREARLVAAAWDAVGVSGEPGKYDPGLCKPKLAVERKPLSSC